MKKILSILFAAGTLFLLVSCADRPATFVRPDNFLTVQAKYDTFIFGTYQLDTDQKLFIDFNGPDRDLLLNRAANYGSVKGVLNYFLIPMLPRSYAINTAYVVDAMTEDYGSYPSDEPAPSYQTKSFPYPFQMTLQKGKIHYIGRFIISNGTFSVADQLTDDKALLLSKFTTSPAAFSNLSQADIIDLKK